VAESVTTHPYAPLPRNLHLGANGTDVSRLRGERTSRGGTARLHAELRSMSEAKRYSAEVQLMPHPKCVRVARRFCALTLEHFGLGCCVETARLLVSELVTNAVLHAHTPIGLRLEVCGDELRIEVRDGFAEMTTTPRVVDVRELPEAGRGLQVVAALGGRWGWERTRAGKVVWCEVPVNALV